MSKAKLAQGCIECGVCTEKCSFLNKYGMNLNQYEAQRKDLAYNCFLCGECKPDCPAGIDGRKIAIDMRENAVKDSQFESRKYLSTIFEKNNYLFKNYKPGGKKSVLFPGCNFPSFYPGTTRKLVKLLGEAADMGVVLDCCGKPISELGLTDDAERIVKGMEKELKKSGVEEIVTLCPNCYYFLKDKLDIRIIDIYEKLHRLDIGNPLLIEDMNIFSPCPDREERLIRNSIEPFISSSGIKEIEGIQCCGLGGHGGIKEPELSKSFIGKLKDMQLKNVYTYCATCCGNFNRNGVEGVKHILCGILQTDEAPATGLKSLVNRAGFKFFI